MVICSTLALLFLLLQSFERERASLLWTCSFASLALIFGADLYGPMSTVSGIDQRTRFLFWLKMSTSARWGAFFWSMLAVGVGISQYSLVRVSGIESVFENYGFMYERFLEGEYWRALTGAYLHYSLLHYVPNIFLLLLIGMLAFPTVGPIPSIATFLLGNTIGLLGQMYFGGSLYDSSGGMSFGIYALFGLVVMSATLRKRLMPPGFALLCAMIALAALAISAMTSAAAATAGHISGLVTGAVVAAVCRRSGAQRTPR